MRTFVASVKVKDVSCKNYNGHFCFFCEYISVS